MRLSAKESCEHWSGEEPYDEARRKEIRNGARRDCDAFQKQLKAARKKYPGNDAFKKNGKVSAAASKRRHGKNIRAHDSRHVVEFQIFGKIAFPVFCSYILALMI